VNDNKKPQVGKRLGPNVWNKFTSIQNRPFCFILTNWLRWIREFWIKNTDEVFQYSRNVGLANIKLFTVLYVDSVIPLMNKTCNDFALPSLDPRAPEINWHEQAYKTQPKAVMISLTHSITCVVHINTVYWWDARKENMAYQEVFEVYLRHVR